MERVPPRATYRVQMHAGFTFDDAIGILPYLADLGVSHLYTSPILQAAPGSKHGYDIVDHSHVNAELGGEDGFMRLIDALRARGMGIVLDIVPNHMAIGEQNRWWWDVLEHGQGSRFASFFDIDWRAGDVILPVLGDDGMAAVRLVRDGERVAIEHGGRRYPIARDTLAQDDDIVEINDDPGRLEDVLAMQHYRLEPWQAATERLNYRRFFDVNDLVGLCVEDEAVFDATHRLILSWVRDGLIDGLRVDHPDGLRDPAAYFARLREAAPEAWIVVEKILGTDERLPRGWPVDGTTGYRFANLATGLLVDQDGEPGMSAVWASMADAGPHWDAIVAEARLEILESVLGSDVNRLAALFTTGSEAAGVTLREVAARLPVYRTYVTAVPRHVTSDDVSLIEAAVAGATEARPDLDPKVFASLGRMLQLEDAAPAATELAMRFQQLTPAAMAKGVEDTAFYRHHRLVALNEVGGDPDEWGTGVDDFHLAMAVAQEEWPLAMLALSTHDTKRSADVRARLALLSEDPEDWRRAVGRLTAASASHRSGAGQPTAADAYLLFQVLVGAWPIDADRAAAYLEKASREAKLRTSWTAPDAAYDEALAAFVRGCLADPAFVSVVEATVKPLIEPGWRASLAQVALQLTAPGVPDLYQGSEVWDLALVDPDNRRPVDYDLRRRLLDETRDMTAAQAWDRRSEGVPKLWLIHRALQLRHRRPEPFGSGAAYGELRAFGVQSSAVVAFARASEVVTVVPRLVRRIARFGWGDTSIELPPGGWRDLDGAEHAGIARAGDLLNAFPVSILERVA